MELNWLLDDAVAARQAPDANGWQPATWRQLEPRGLQLQIVDQLAGTGTDADTVAGNECIVALRADTAALTNLWRQRVEYRSANAASRTIVTTTLPANHTLMSLIMDFDGVTWVPC